MPYYSPLKVGISPPLIPCFLNHGPIKHEQYVEPLLDYDAPLDPAGNGGQDLSAVGVAVEAGYEAIVPRLVEVRAQPGSCEIPGPIERAFKDSQRGLAEFLLEYGVRQTSDFGLIYATEQNDNALLQLLAENGAD
ncbi:hypothetical protein AARAC_002043 [Aspergillus arachidicola]|uniref:Ankyrin repeat-containing domain protein n=1 Tax=Aspergillus arachidicola TaxID=656916 RepID=A0A2G7G145_9EURO|nr:hypothetical protein AARAC_002043 [Aspergillus arachidicola]